MRATQTHPHKGRKMITYYKCTPTKDTFAPEIHEWVAAVNGRYIYVLKDTDRWTPLYSKVGMTVMTASDVPADIRRKAGQRLGGARRAEQVRNPRASTATRH